MNNRPPSCFERIGQVCILVGRLALVALVLVLCRLLWR